LFIAAADELYEPITVLRRDRRIVKKIPWSAFKISEVDWIRVLDAKSILEVRSSSSSSLSTAYIKINRIPITFSNTSLLKSNLRYGAPSPRSRNFRPHGRRNTTSPNMLSTKRPSMMALQNSTSTILGLTRNQAIY